MYRFNRLLVIGNSILATILVLVMVSFAPSIANGASSTILACANKETGALRIAYKACKKGENNVSWSITGPQGVPGPAGSVSSVVKDANGVAIPNVTQIGNDGKVFVLNGGKIWQLNVLDGTFKASLESDLVNASIYDLPRFFTDSTCTGDGYVGRRRPETSVMFQTFEFTEFTNGGMTLDPNVYGAISSTPTMTNPWTRQPTGCSQDPYNVTPWYLYPLTVLTPPAAYTGPLQLVGQ